MITRSSLALWERYPLIMSVFKYQLQVYSLVPLVNDHRLWLLDKLKLMCPQYLPCSKFCVILFAAFSVKICLSAQLGLVRLLHKKCTVQHSQLPESREGTGKGWAEGLGGYMGKHYMPVCLVWSGQDWLVIYETGIPHLFSPSLVLLRTHFQTYAHTQMYVNHVMSCHLLLLIEDVSQDGVFNFELYLCTDAWLHTIITH